MNATRSVSPLVRPAAFATLTVAVLLSVLPAPVGAQSASAAPATATWYITTYTNDVLVWDEASEQVVDRIRMNNRIPRSIVVNEAKDRLYVMEARAEIVEVVDLATRRVIEEHQLSSGAVTVRISGFAPHPSDQRAVLFAKRYTALADRYVVEGPFILEYDLRTRQVTDTIPWPDNQERENVGFRYSPDGRTLYLFTDDIIALDADTFEEVDRWKISQPLEPGLGRPSFGVFPGTYDEPGVATSLFRMTDPVHNRRLMGIARVRLSEKEVDFYTLGDAQPVGNLNVAPSGQKAYGLFTEIGRYEFWEFDLAGRTVARRVPFEGRPRMGLRVSADGSKLYIYVAGNTIDVYDAATFEYLRTVEFDEDMNGVAVIPAGAGSGG